MPQCLILATPAFNMEDMQTLSFSWEGLKLNGGVEVFLVEFDVSGRNVLVERPTTDGPTNRLHQRPIAHR